jgi:hypothetical protein
MQGVLLLAVINRDIADEVIASYGNDFYEFIIMCRQWRVIV